MIRRVITTFAVALPALLSIGLSSPPATLTADALFKGDFVPTIKLSLAEPAIVSLREAPRRKVEGFMQLAAGPSLPVRVRLKGHGSFQPVDFRPNLTIDFPDSGLFGLEKLHLNNSLEDCTFISEKVATELFSSAGVVAPRVGHVRLNLNGRDVGLYVLKEGFTSQFLSRSGLTPGGDWSENDVERLTAAVREPNLARRWQQLCALLDIDQFSSFMAEEVLMCHWDGYSTAGHNVHIYHDPLHDKYIFFPTGMDQIFGNPRYPAVPDMTGAIARGFMETAEGRNAYEARFAELRAKFNGEDCAAKAGIFANSLRPWLSRSEWMAIDANLREWTERIIARGRFLHTTYQRDSIDIAKN